MFKNLCNGKCYLKKQLQKADESENKNQPFSQTETTPFQSFIQITDGYFNALTSELTVQLATQTEVLISSYFNSIFHPPG